MAGRLRIWLALGPRFLNSGGAVVATSVSMVFCYEEENERKVLDISKEAVSAEN